MATASSPPRGGHAIAFATLLEVPRATADDALALAALEAHCGEAHAVAWDDPQVDWGRYATVVIRSTWNYHLHPADFLGWADRVEAAGAELRNPAATVRWNMDKRYLRDLERAGVPIVPTEWIARGSAVDLRDVLDGRGWERAVVKPSISAGAFRTWPVALDEADSRRAEMAELLADADALVQPFLAEVPREGEWSLVFFAGEDGALAFSHAVLSRPAEGDFRVQTRFGGLIRREEPSADLLGQAIEMADVIGRVAPGPLLYTRLDGIVSDGAHAPAGTFLLSEAELIEPRLFLGFADHAPDRFAAAIARDAKR